MRRKWRRYRRACAVAVIRDGLEGCGLYPFRFYDFRKIASEKRIAAARARDGAAFFSQMLREIYSPKIELLAYGGPGAYPAYQHRSLGR